MKQTDSIERIYEIEGLDELADYLKSFDDDAALTELLYERFLSFANYSTAEQWNKAVRLCECLAITGWGAHQGVEAHVGKYFNGYPNTFFITPDNEVLYLDAVWMRRDGGYVIDTHRSMLKSMPDAEICSEVCCDTSFDSQRNRLAKCPVQIVRYLANCYPSSADVVNSIMTELNPMLLRQLRPQVYGNLINRIYINCALSYYDNSHCKTNYIIADEKQKIRKSDYYSTLLSMYDVEEIEREGLYLRPRFDIGPLRKDSGNINVTIVFEREFSELTTTRQKEVMASYFIEALRRIATRQRKADYNFGALIDDFQQVVQRWATGQNCVAGR